MFIKKKEEKEEEEEESKLQFRCQIHHDENIKQSPRCRAHSNFKVQKDIGTAAREGQKVSSKLVSPEGTRLTGLVPQTCTNSW